MAQLEPIMDHPQRPVNLICKLYRLPCDWLDVLYLYIYSTKSFHVFHLKFDWQKFRKTGFLTSADAPAIVTSRSCDLASWHMYASIHMHTYIYGTCICMHVFVYMQICTCTHIYTHTSIHMHTYMHMYVYMYAYTDVCTGTHTYTYMHVYVYVCLCVQQHAL